MTVMNVDNRGGNTAPSPRLYVFHDNRPIPKHVLKLTCEEVAQHLMANAMFRWYFDHGADFQTWVTRILNYYGPSEKAHVPPALTEEDLKELLEACCTIAAATDGN